MEEVSPQSYITKTDPESAQSHALKFANPYPFSQAAREIPLFFLGSFCSGKDLQSSNNMLNNKEILYI